MAKKMGKYERARALVELEKQLDKIFVAKALDILSAFRYNADDPIEVKNFVKGLRKITENAIARRIEKFDEKATAYLSEQIATAIDSNAVESDSNEVTDNE